MTAALALASEANAVDPVADWLDRLLAGMADLVTHADEATDAERVDRITVLERLKAAVGAVQVAEIVRFGRSQVEAQRSAGVHPRRLGRGIADQIALACGTGPADGVRRLDDARALWFDMPGCLDLLTTGRISEWVAHWWLPKPAISTASPAAGSTPNSYAEGWPTFLPERLRPAPGSWRTKPTHRGRSPVAGPPASSGGLPCAPRRTR